MAKKIRFSKKNKVVGNLKKAVVVSLASMMMVQTFSVSAHATPVYAATAETIADAPVVNGEYEDFMSGAIKKLAGNIPVIGGYTDLFLDPILKMIFGAEDNISNKLEEISSKLDSLSLQLNISTQEILKEEYARELNDFNNKITDIRDATSDYLKKIETIENGNYSPAEKSLKIATLFQLDTGNTAEYVNLIRNASAYLAGKNIDTTTVDPVFVKAFKLKCSESVFGGEAAARAGLYVNEVYEIMDAAYKVEAVALDARLGLVNALTGKDATEGEYDALMSKYSEDADKRKLLKAAKYGDDIGNWTSAANTLKSTYDALFSLDNANSIACKYNTMVKNFKYCYIKEAKYSRNAVITFVPLSTKMDNTNYDKSGLDRSLVDADLGKYQDTYFKTIKDFGDRCKASGLDENDVKKIMTHMEQNSAFFTKDHKASNSYIALGEYGFDIGWQILDSSRWFSGPMGTTDELMNTLKPIVVGNSWTQADCNCPVAKAYLSGYDLNGKTMKKVFYAFYLSGTDIDDKALRALLFFQKTDMPENPFDNTSSDNLVALIDSMDCAMTAALTTSDVDIPEENNEENKEEAVITLTVDPEGQISGDQMNEAWTVAEDGTIILNKDNKFRFEGTVADKNIQNYGEIVDGNFKNVKLELVDNAVITKGTFEDCEITTNENAVIGEEVELINTTIIDANNIENREEEEQKEDPQEVVEETLVSENDMF